jgi:hypothetical protein
MQIETNNAGNEHNRNNKFVFIVSKYSVCNFSSFDTTCRTPTLAKCGGEAQHLEKSGVGVLRDSRMFRDQQQGPKHLALGCSWCHWKGLEV